MISETTLPAQSELIVQHDNDAGDVSSENRYDEDSSSSDVKGTASPNAEDINCVNDEISDSCNWYEVPVKTSDVKIVFNKVDHMLEYSYLRESHRSRNES